MKKSLIIIIGALLMGALSFSSCNNPIALGSRLNLDPPELTLTKPDFMENC